MRTYGYVAAMLAVSLSSIFAVSVQAMSKSKSQSQQAAASGANASQAGGVMRALPEVIKDRLDGLALEDEATKEAIQKEINEYLGLKRRGMPGDARTVHALRCQSGKESEPFCRLYMKKAAAARGETRNKWQTKLKARALARSMKKAHKDPQALAELNKANEQDLINALKEFNAASHLEPLSQKLVSDKECPSPGLLTALGLKVEHLLPQEKHRDLAVKLYEKALACGGPDAVVKSGYRLALLYIWLDRYADAESILSRIIESNEARDYRQRIAYWRLHCARKLKNAAIISQMQNMLLKESPLSLHGLLTHESQIMNSSDPRVRFRSATKPELNPIVAAAEMLHRQGATEHAADLLDTIVEDARGAEAEFKLYLVVLYQRAGEVLTVFQTMAGLFRDHPNFISRSTLEMLYPREKYDMITGISPALDPWLVLSLIRQESAFNERARSRAGAMGLMQVMPATARRIARVSRRELLQPETNVRIGTKYFARLLQKYNNDVELALAAYNAGPDRVDEWQKRYPVSNKLLFLDLMPYRETREYVASIARNYYWYLHLYSGERLEAYRRTASETPQANPKAAFSVLRIANDGENVN